MDEYVYNSFLTYFKTVCTLGYVQDTDVEKLLILSLYNDLLSNDYRGYISKEDLEIINKALNCLYGTSCLIPFPTNTDMATLKLGDISELSHRVKSLENPSPIIIWVERSTMKAHFLDAKTLIEFNVEEIIDQLEAGRSVKCPADLEDIYDRGIYSESGSFQFYTLVENKLHSDGRVLSLLTIYDDGTNDRILNFIADTQYNTIIWDETLNGEIANY